MDFVSGVRKCGVKSVGLKGVAAGSGARGGSFGLRCVSLASHISLARMVVLALGGTEKVLMDLDMALVHTWHSVPNWWQSGNSIVVSR